MTEPPTPSELDRRLTELARDQRTGFANLNQRLDTFPTERTILALFETRDTQILTLQQRLLEVSSELDQEKRDRENGDKDIEKRAADARRWAIGTAITVAGLCTAILGFAASVLGGN